MESTELYWTVETTATTTAPVILEIPEDTTETINGWFTTDGQTLKRIIANAAKFTGKSPNPLHCCIGIRINADTADGTAAMFTGTDGEHGTRQTLKRYSYGQPVDMLTDAATLNRIAAKLAKRPEIGLEIETTTTRTPRTEMTTDPTAPPVEEGQPTPQVRTWTGEWIEHSTSKLHITAGETKIELTPPDTFEPEIIAQYWNLTSTADARHLATFDTLDLLAVLNRAAFPAIRAGGPQVHYTEGIYLDPRPEDRTLNIIATDGHRLAIERTRPLLADADTLETFGSRIIRARTVDTIARQLDKKNGETGIYFTANGRTHIAQEDSDTASTWTVQQFDVKFPPYERVIPKDITATATVDSSEMLEALDVLAVITPGNEHACIYLEDHNGHAVDLSATYKTKKASHRLDADTTGDSMKVALNPGYIADALKATGKHGTRTKINYQSEVSPVMLTIPALENWTYIVMPIRMD